MSVVDVGDALELTFSTTPGATVTVSWISPAGEVVLQAVPVAESATTPGDYPYTFAPGAEGVWEARFYASGTVSAVERYYVRARSVSGPPPLATVGEVEELFGSMTPAQATLTGALLRRASEMLRAHLTGLAQQIADGALSIDAPAMAAINMVLRVLRNPNGLRAESRGPFSTTYDTTVAAGLLVVSDAEVALMTTPVDDASVLPVGSVIADAGLARNTWGDSVAYQLRGSHGWW